MRQLKGLIVFIAIFLSIGRVIEFFEDPPLRTRFFFFKEIARKGGDETERQKLTSEFLNVKRDSRELGDITKFLEHHPQGTINESVKQIAPFLIPRVRGSEGMLISFLNPASESYESARREVVWIFLVYFDDKTNLAEFLAKHPKKRINCSIVEIGGYLGLKGHVIEWDISSLEEHINKSDSACLKEAKETIPWMKEQTPRLVWY